MGYGPDARRRHVRRTNTEVKEVRIRHTGTERKRAGHRTAKEGCPCPGLGSCLGWGRQGAGPTPLQGGGIVAAPVQEWTPGV